MVRSLTSDRRSPLATVRQWLPEGTAVVAVGLLISGASTYAYLALTARQVGPERYGAISALWAIVVLTALGFFIPVEQEVARAISARRALGRGSRPVVERAGAAAAGLAGLLAVTTFVVSGSLRSELFDGSWMLLVCFAGALVAYAGVHLTRGVLSGLGHFTGYGLLMAAEGVIRLVGCVVLAVAGVEAPGPYGVVLAGSAALAVVVVLFVERNLLEPGPPAPFAELATALGHLLAGSVMAQILLNGPPLAVKLLADEHEREVAGRFLAGLIIARIPVFLSAAVQAALLPRLSGLVAAGQAAEFRSSLRRLLLLVAAVSTAGVVASAAIGQPLVRLLFGPGFTLRSVDLAILAAASGVYLVALVLAQGLIAVGAQSRVTPGWTAGVLAFAAALTVHGPIVTRVEVAFLIGSAAASVVMAGLLLPRLPIPGEQRDAVFDAPIVIDPLEP